VMEVDVARKRIGLSMKLDAAPARRDGPRDNRFEAAGKGQRTGQQGTHQGTNQRGGQALPQGGAMASAFAKLGGLRK
jgi:protein Tex